ncbi:hypothetical protein SISNIDRAFT_490497 [Sistotremastrum niveocremeum HHB9708]|uniref:RING-type domain-containing protein n=1 Tax=Sistotremastrum niveocremeum HHB9708 TaxID=1314777 RepID=A0A164NRX0_9AGAM|nr:hypothetical protein SISNIDRAFT_490497 [Sistotremastrum niveocremeum HHB9708]
MPIPQPGSSYWKARRRRFRRRSLLDKETQRGSEGGDETAATFAVTGKKRKAWASSESSSASPEHLRPAKKSSRRVVSDEESDQEDLDLNHQTSLPCGGTITGLDLFPETETPMDVSSVESTDNVKVLERHTRLLSTLSSVLSCDICLDMLEDPYTLYPCGHVACGQCLISWFKTPGQGHDRRVHDAPLTMQSKICPKCRCQIFSAPVRAFALQAVVRSLREFDSRASLESLPKEAKEPWLDIFPPIHNRSVQVIIDDEDGGISRCPYCLHELLGNECTGCGHMFEGEEVHLSDSELEDEHGMGSDAIHSNMMGEENIGLTDLSDESGYESSFIDDTEEREPGIGDYGAQHTIDLTSDGSEEPDGVSDIVSEDGFL